MRRVMTLSRVQRPVRRKAVWGLKLTLAVAAIFVTGFASNALADGRHSRTAKKVRSGEESSQAKQYKSDDEVTRRSSANPLQTSSVIVTLVPGAQLPPEFKKFARAGGKLDIINGQVLDLPNGLLRKLAAHPEIFRIHDNRPIKTHNYRTSVTVGGRSVIAKYGYTGVGVGIAVIDSGITSWHDDLMNFTSKVFPYGNQRVAKFVDFVNGRTLPYDDNGHGTHVAGTIAGLGYDSGFEKAGIAPDA